MSAYSVVIPTTEDSEGDQIERLRFVAEASMRWLYASLLWEANPEMSKDEACAKSEEKLSVTVEGRNLYVNGGFLMECVPSYD